MSTIIDFFSQYNWIDYLVFLGLILFMIEGYTVGFVAGMMDVIGFLLAFGVGLRIYRPLGDIILRYIPLPQMVVYSVIFAFTAIFVELGFRLLEEKLGGKLQKEVGTLSTGLIRTNKIFGIFTGFLAGFVLITFLLTIMVVFPVSSIIKQGVSSSTVGTLLVSKAQSAEGDLTRFFGGTSHDFLTFLTVEPDAKGTLPLTFKVANGTDMPIIEDDMLASINAERAKVQLPPLSMDEQLRDVAKAYAQDMLSMGYFSHYSIGGKSPFDRLDDAGIQYDSAGENLAFSANMQLAMQGLMQSPGHKANILSPDFHKVGIGVIDAGSYGQMFVQEFTN